MNPGIWAIPQRLAAKLEATAYPKDHSLQLTITRYKATAQYFTEDLGNDIGLDMVLISGGTFLMGPPEDEVDRYDDESLQHPVTVPDFFMSASALCTRLPPRRQTLLARVYFKTPLEALISHRKE